MGGRQAVAEAWRNLVAVGARPTITNCLNFGNPERPAVMGQLVGCIEGMAAACRPSTSRSCPATSRSTTRPTNAILPTPNVGGLGVIERLDAITGIAWLEADLTLILLGDAWAGSAPRSTGASSCTATTAPRRRSTSPPSGAPASSCARSSPAGARLPRPGRRPRGGRGRDVPGQPAWVRCSISPTVRPAVRLVVRRGPGPLPAGGPARRCRGDPGRGGGGRRDRPGGRPGPAATR